MKDKPLSPELDSIELHADAMERTEALIKATVRHKPTDELASAPKRSVVDKRKP